MQARDRRLEAGRGQEGQGGQHAAVDLAGEHVAAAAAVDLDARVGQHAALQRALAEQQDLADGRVARVGPEERVLARRRGRSPSTPAASSRRGSAWDRRLGAPLPAGRIEKCRCGAWRVDRLVDATEHRAADDLGARAQLAQDDVVAVESQDLLEVRLVGAVARHRLAEREPAAAHRRRGRSCGGPGCANRRSLASVTCGHPVTLRPADGGWLPALAGLRRARVAWRRRERAADLRGAHRAAAWEPGRTSATSPRSA